MMDLGWEIWLLGLGGALAVGLGKGGVPGVGNLTVVLYAMAFGGKPSVGLLLPVLMSADALAIYLYRRDAAWKHLFRLVPWMFLGILCGYFLMDAINSRQVEILIGVIVLSMSAVHFGRLYYLKSHPQKEDRLPHSLPFRGGMGILGGFATMVANAAGPVGELYFASMRLPKMVFVGTKAWCFFLINWIKIPFFLDLDLITGESMQLSILFMPAALLGAWMGPWLVRRIHPRLFSFLVWIFIIFAGIKMLWG